MNKPLKAIPVSSAEVNAPSAGHRGNIVSRHPRPAALLGSIAAVAALAYGAVSHFRADALPTIGIHTTLPECRNGHKDTRPQPSELYEGQTITIGIGDKALSHTVTLMMMLGGLLEQEHVDEGVTLVTESLPATTPGGKPAGLQMTYKLDGHNQVTLTTHPGAGSSPLLTPYEATRVC